MQLSNEVPVSFSGVAEAPREWVSFDDAEGNTFLFDVTFLLSNWVCTWDAGCPGILDKPTPELEQGCCSFGAHFSDSAERTQVMEAAARLTPDQWQFHNSGQPLFITDDDGAEQTALLDNACIFLNRPGFAGGAGCALHRGALDAGERAMDWKPDVCWQLPLRLDESVDDNDLIVTTLRQWRRPDWGEGGKEIHSICTEHDQAFIEQLPVYQTLAEEIIEMVGEPLYQRLVQHIEQRRPGHYLPHPAASAPLDPEAEAQ